MLQNLANNNNSNKYENWTTTRTSTMLKKDDGELWLANTRCSIPEKNSLITYSIIENLTFQEGEKTNDN